jgi:8-oxo-dGTP diphosphatase
MDKMKNKSNWGSDQQPFWRPGANRTVDLIIKKGDEVLLIKRGAEPFKGHWALPGGFQDTDAKKGEVFKEGKETAKEAALRELKEETSLYEPSFKERIREVGLFDQFGRDPRDNDEAFAVSRAFIIEIVEEEASSLRAGDDAVDAKFVSLKDLKETELAFDHFLMLKKAGLV